MQARIKILLEHLGITPAAFADTLKVPRSSVSHILSGRNNPSLEFLRKMLITYPNISSDWLLLGQGAISRADVVDKPKLSAGYPAGATNEPKLMRGQNQPEDTGHAEQKTGPVKEREPELMHLRGNTNENREHPGPPVEKVIIFYADGTFKQYSPRDKA